MKGDGAPLPAVHAGLVERLSDLADGRGTVAALTAAGRAALKRAAPLYLHAIERHFTNLLSHNERKIIAVVLSRVASRHRDRSNEVRRYERRNRVGWHQRAGP